MSSCLLQDIPCGKGNHSDRKVGLVVEKVIDQEVKNTIKAGGSTAFEQNVDWVSGWSG